MARVNSAGYSIPSTPNSCTSVHACWWQDGNVWDTDLADPDLIGANALDKDSSNFDQSTVGISFFQGHGAGGWTLGNAIQCNASNWSTQCTQGNGPFGNTGVGCVVTPASQSQFGAGLGYCRWDLPNKNPAFITC